MSPEQLRTDDDSRLLFRDQHIGWVVRAPDCTESLDIALKRWHRKIFLSRCTGTVEDWAGNRIGGTRQLQPITILSV